MYVYVCFWGVFTFFSQQADNSVSSIRKCDKNITQRMKIEVSAIRIIVQKLIMSKHVYEYDNFSLCVSVCVLELVCPLGDPQSTAQTGVHQSLTEAEPDSWPGQQDNSIQLSDVTLRENTDTTTPSGLPSPRLWCKHIAAQRDITHW